MCPIENPSHKYIEPSNSITKDSISVEINSNVLTVVTLVVGITTSFVWTQSDIRANTKLIETEVSRVEYAYENEIQTIFVKFNNPIENLTKIVKENSGKIDEMQSRSQAQNSQIISDLRIINGQLVILNKGGNNP
jgi:hypothetical protein